TGDTTGNRLFCRAGLESGWSVGDSRQMRSVFIVVLALLQPVWSFAQASTHLQIAQSLPAAPMPQQVPDQGSPAMAPNEPPSPNAQGNAATSMSLSLKEAEALALKNNPQISVARLTALASQQVTREVRSNLWPAATANLT